MSRTLLLSVLFVAGLAAPLWIGAGYLGHHAVGAAVAALIAACFLIGGVELLGFARATRQLANVLRTPINADSDLGSWLQGLPGELRAAVRLRVEGERTALPGPALTPYLVGLLVLLGMLGTLLGMMATLRGTGLALESATDLQAIRGSLASPVEGLAVAFGTSIAGVAASAMLGLLSAVLRRERSQAVQALDARIAGDLHGHTRRWQRAESLRLLQLQSDTLPPLVDRLQAVLDGMQSAQQRQGEQMLAQQEAFQTRSERTQQQLIEALQVSLQRGAQDSAAAVAGTLQPLVQRTLEGLASEGARQHAGIQSAVQQQLEALAQGFAGASAAVSQSWRDAVKQQADANAVLIEHLQQALAQTAKQQGQAQQQVLQTVGTQLQAQAEHNGLAWQQAAEHQRECAEAAATANAQAWASALQAQQAQAEALLARLQQQAQQQQGERGRDDAARLQQWSAAFAALAEQASAQWLRSGEQQAQQHQQVCNALAKTGEQLHAQARTHADATIASISRLIDAAAEAPRAAAEVIGELRERLSESLVRDTAMLEERAQLLGTLQSLTEAVTHASTEQRGAVDALIDSAGSALDRASSRFAEQVEHGTGRMDGLAAQLLEGAQALGTVSTGMQEAVQAFGSTSGTLGEKLQQVGAALDASMARSDEQLAYYVAQAREVVDLTLLSQKQLLAELQQLGAAAPDTRA